MMCLRHFIEHFVKRHSSLTYIGTSLLLVLLGSLQRADAIWSSPNCTLLKLSRRRTDGRKFDGLILLSAFELQSRHPHFGAISGLSMGADARLYAVSDCGYWRSARIRHDSEGRLIDLFDWQIKPLLTRQELPAMDC
jgi:hypothetical protein